MNTIDRKSLKSRFSISGSFARLGKAIATRFANVAPKTARRQTRGGR